MSLREIIVDAGHYSAGSIINRIIINQSQGVQVFGLPFAKPFCYLPFFRMRLWILSVIVLFAMLHYTGRVSSFYTVLISYTFILAVVGVSSQYLFWPIPFLLITRHFKAAGFYSLIVTIFLLLYYMNPWAPYMPFENMNTFTTLRSFRWLMPSLFFVKKSLLPFIHLLGNYLIPGFCFSLVIYLMTVAMKSLRTDIHPAPEKRGDKPAFALLKSWYLWPTAIVLATLFLTSVATSRKKMLPIFQSRLTEKFDAYAFRAAESIRSLSIGYIGDYPGGSKINIITILFVLSALWTLSAIVISRKKDSIG